MAMTKLGIALRGVCMGAADAVPGVSGGTIALITGIYPRLIAAVSRFDLAWLKVFRRDGFRVAMEQVDAAFLIPLAIGLVVGLIGLSGLVLAGLEAYPALVWACFLGLVLGAVPMLIQRAEFRSPAAVRQIPLAIVGWLFAAGLGWLDVGLPHSSLGYFMGGVLALSAMILPGLSGSFILLLLGLYQPFSLGCMI